MIQAWVITGWRQRTVNGKANNSAPAALGDEWEELAGTGARNIPPGINVGFWRVDNLADAAAVDALNAVPGVVVIAAVAVTTDAQGVETRAKVTGYLRPQDKPSGAQLTGYLRPQDKPSGAQLTAAKTRLQNAGIPTGELTTRISVGMTLAQVADALRAYAKDLTK